MPPHLVPTPRQITAPGGVAPWPADNLFLPLDPDLQPVGSALARFCDTAAALTGGQWQPRGTPDSPTIIQHRLLHDDSLPPEVYRLTLGSDGIRLASSGWRGAFYGLQTLTQIVRAHPEAYPYLEINDAPSRRNRGYLLDISRNKVPRRETLCALIDQLAGLKYNQLQLYIEHTFAFPGHAIVWGDASPLTAEDIRFLDTYAAERAIELVPNFNSFGHFERWLRHPEYFKYAECPYGWRRPDGHGMPWGSTLSPSPESRELLASLHREFLPLFQSRQCNIGGDEPWELGMGRSREACSELGKHEVYLDFLASIVAIAGEHKDRIQFWADIVLERPEIVARLDPRLIAMVWGYEADHPLEAQAAHFAEHDLPFYICPGTSTWNSLGTRLGNARPNIEAAGRAAELHDAEGLLLTDWGDNGHHQPAIVSLPALFLSAQAGWAPETVLDDLEAAVAIHGFRADGDRLAPLLFRLGRIDRHFSFRPHNRMPLVAVLSAREQQLNDICAELRTDELVQCAKDLGQLSRDIDALALADKESLLVREELSVTAGLLLHAAKRALVHRTGSGHDANSLRAEFTALIGRFETAWIRRNRVGGLCESGARFRRALETYPSQPPRRPAWPPTAWE